MDLNYKDIEVISEVKFGKEMSKRGFTRGRITNGLAAWFVKLKKWIKVVTK